MGLAAGAVVHAGEPFRDSFGHVAPEAASRAVRVEDERPAARRHGGALGHREGHAHLLRTLHLGRAVRAEHEVAVGRVRVGLGALLEDGERDERVQLVEGRVSSRRARAVAGGLGARRRPGRAVDPAGRGRRRRCGDRSCELRPDVGRVTHGEHRRGQDGRQVEARSPGPVSERLVLWPRGHQGRIARRRAGSEHGGRDPATPGWRSPWHRDRTS